MSRAVRTRKRVSKRRGRSTSKLRSLKVTAAFKSFVLDQIDDLGDVTSRPMFGCVGLYHRGVFFGILANDKLFLRVGAANRDDYEGMAAFQPYRDRPSAMRYHE